MNGLQSHWQRANPDRSHEQGDKPVSPCWWFCLWSSLMYLFQHTVESKFLPSVVIDRCLSVQAAGAEQHDQNMHLASDAVTLCAFLPKMAWYCCRHPTLRLTAVSDSTPCRILLKIIWPQQALGFQIMGYWIIKLLLQLAEADWPEIKRYVYGSLWLRRLRLFDAQSFQFYGLSNRLQCGCGILPWSCTASRGWHHKCWHHESAVHGRLVCEVQLLIVIWHNTIPNGAYLMEEDFSPPILSKISMSCNLATLMRARSLQSRLLCKRLCSHMITCSWKLTNLATAPGGLKFLHSTLWLGWSLAYLPSWKVNLLHMRHLRALITLSPHSMNHDGSCLITARIQAVWRSNYDPTCSLDNTIQIWIESCWPACAQKQQIYLFIDITGTAETESTLCRMLCLWEF